MPAKTLHIPAYCLHKATGRAYVTLSGRVVYLGKYKLAADGTPDSPAYHKLIAKWLGNERKLPVIQTSAEATALTVVELIAKFWEHVQKYYRNAEGETTGEVESFRQALRPLKRGLPERTARETRRGRGVSNGEPLASPPVAPYRRHTTPEAFRAGGRPNGAGP